ncbi:acetylgalactosamine 3-beta-galactosyltransferase 1 [Seminavis robusta]|uniref:N-acetylgalactosaminide beta-1,3-galactosyltransferase n=1 Tax=Seminavis robusta TaxID=568900 RepID=A0A9N8H6H9_9STRA|nr:acetylgalactosamine 3-beta-galactosyltransferase 1 [Seminavis robusta]|eukprot:Sro172_g075900.1 acetylgalactosamine 3-beta-galactosyltransferase 1 (358) ;mRNA; r:14959-16032
MECGWEECLAAQTKCRTCRQEPLGDPPPPVDNDWIPDVTMLHRMFLQGKDSNDKPWPPRVGGDICKDFWNGRDINKQLFQQVPVSIVAPPPAAKAPKGPKIFCGIYTMAKAHSLTIRAMRETWAPRCDGFLAFSTQSDPRIPAISITHEGPEEYNNMWQKSRAIWKFIGDHYLQEQEYDYFFLGGEDLFVIVDNLRAYLGTLASGPEEDHFVGRRFKGHGPDNYFNSGGAGYALSRGTLRKYIERGYDHPDCAAHRHTSMEDVMMAQCLRKVFGIGLTDTRDDKGRERFHPFAPGSHLTRKKDEHDWYNDYNKEWGIGYGTDCCAPDSVSFHYIKKATMVRHLHALLYECGDGTSKQ